MSAVSPILSAGWGHASAGRSRETGGQMHVVPLHQKHDVLYEGMEPQSQLYTRAQIAALTSIDASSLNYWSREGLLVPSEGGGGQGSHRRFDFVQVNIAAIFGELKRFGVNIGALRPLADLLQSAAVMGSGNELHPSNYLTAARLGTMLDRFHRGEQIMVPVHVGQNPPENLSGHALSNWYSVKKLATTERDIVNKCCWTSTEYNTADDILVVANRIGAGRETVARIYGDLVFGVLTPGYSGAYSWVLALDNDNTWRVAFGDEGKFFDSVHSEGPESFGSGLFIPVSGVFRRIWKLKPDELIRAEQQAQGIAKKLAAAGIVASVTPRGTTRDDGYDIDAPGVDIDEIEAAMKFTYARFAVKA